MIICINCTPETKARMDGMLGQNRYRDYSELIAIAVDNLWIMEQEVGDKGALVIGESPPPRSAPAAPAVSPSVGEAKRPGISKAARKPSPRGKTRKPNAVAPMSAPSSVPELFVAAGLDALPAIAAETPGAEEDPTDAFTLDRWIFGQYNKLLPLKANSRALLRLTAEHREGVSLQDAAPRIAEAAALLGDFLYDQDRRSQAARDDALATAFPRSGPDAEKSRSRYANQFVGVVNSQGILSGLLRDYRMAALAPGADPRLMPTAPAVQFARLPNPVLDQCQTGPAQKFLPEEVAWLLDHIRTHVPVEAFAFQTLLLAIADGADTPDKLDEALRVHGPADSNRSLSPSFLTSQRSGALSRMADLGLIARHRTGVRVSYMITAEGETFIKRNDIGDARGGSRQ